MRGTLTIEQGGWETRANFGARLSALTEKLSRLTALADAGLVLQIVDVWGISMKKLIAAVATTALVAGCATSPKDIAPVYVSPVLYQGLSCEQLAAEAARVSAAAAVATGAQEQQAGKDAAMVGVSLILFWPAAFLVGGDKGNAAEIARLKGEMQAIEHANIQKNCGIQFQPG